MPASGSVQTILSKLPRPKESHDHRIESRYVRNCRIGWRKESCQRPYCGMVERPLGTAIVKRPGSRKPAHLGSQRFQVRSHLLPNYDLLPLIH